ncbi:MAG TPA: hypothetical protein VMZ69_10750 [Saprospiraceae bacterium]|nr:hypothetical protein [Saprospiraceae bacterium]
MAISNLTSLTAAQYSQLQISSFPSPPSISFTGSPDRNIGIQLGGWVGTDVLAFMVNEAVGFDTTINIDSIDLNTLDLNVTTDSDPTAETTYWTVNMGAGASSSNWQISMVVEAGGTKTGKWIFTKGKTDDVNTTKY